ncbi:MAG: PDZ domain-containing protein [Phycisphaerae bacterium]
MHKQPFRCAVTTALALSFCPAVVPAAGNDVSTADWLHIVPGDVKLYVELRNLNAIRAQFRHLGIWGVVRELSRPDESRATTQPWHRRAESSLDLDPEAAISQVLGRRAALIAAHLQDWQAGVLLAELPAQTQLRTLLRRWNARAASGAAAVQRYTLRGGIALAVRGRTLVFGPAADTSGLWARTVRLLEGRRGPSLANQSEFAGLRSRLAIDESGIAFASWPGESEAQPAGAIRSNRLLVGFSITPTGIDCELHGQAAGAPALASTEACLDLARLPATTLACWSGSFDPSSFIRPLDAQRAASDISLVELFLGFLSPPTPKQSDLAAELGPRFTVVVDSDRRRSEKRYELPWLSLILEARDAAAVNARLQPVVQLFLSLLSAPGPEDAPSATAVPIHSETCEDVEVRSVALGELLAKRPALSFLSGIELCWGNLDGRLILSSSREHVESIVRAVRGKAPVLAGERGFAELGRPVEGSEPVVEWLHVRGSALSRMLTSLLLYTMREHPTALSGRWWRSWASERLRQKTRLGVGLKPDATNDRRAVVVEISPVSPARGRLRIGDIIVAVAGAPLTTTRPATEVAKRYGQRGEAREFSLTVLRDGETLDISVPVAPGQPLDLSRFDPPRAIRYLAALLRRIRVLSIRRLAAGPAELNARAIIRWDPPKPRRR